MSLDSIADSIGTVEFKQEQDDHDRLQTDDGAGLPDQSGDYEVESGW